MADCKDIDSALNNLAGKVDNFNSKFKGLEDRVKKAESCCSNKLKQEEADKKQDLSAILARLAALEDVVGRIARYIDSLENAIKSALEPLRILASLLNIF